MTLKLIVFDKSGECILFVSFQIRPAGIDRDAIQFQGLRLEHLTSISND